MAAPTHTAKLAFFSWRRPTNVLRRGPRALSWAVGLALLWAILRPPLTLAAGMVRWRPPGSEQLYFAGMGIGILVDLLAYAFLLVFLLRRERWAQVGIIAFGILQAAYWGLLLASSPGGAVAVPPNYPFGSEALLPRDAMYAISAILPAMGAIAAAWPSVWTWTYRETRLAARAEAST